MNENSIWYGGCRTICQKATNAALTERIFAWIQEHYPRNPPGARIMYVDKTQLSCDVYDGKQFNAWLKELTDVKSNTENTKTTSDLFSAYEVKTYLDVGVTPLATSLEKWRRICAHLATGGTLTGLDTGTGCACCIVYCHINCPLSSNIHCDSTSCCDGLYEEFRKTRTLEAARRVYSCIETQLGKVSDKLTYTSEMLQADLAAGVPVVVCSIKKFEHILKGGRDLGIFNCAYCKTCPACHDCFFSKKFHCKNGGSCQHVDSPYHALTKHWADVHDDSVHPDTVYCPECVTLVKKVLAFLVAEKERQAELLNKYIPQHIPTSLPCEQDGHVLIRQDNDNYHCLECNREYSYEWLLNKGFVITFSPAFRIERKKDV